MADIERWTIEGLPGMDRELVNVSGPNIRFREQVKVVRAEDYDALAEQLRGAVKAVPGTEHYEATGDALCGNVMLHARGASSIFAQTYNLAGAEKIAAALNDHQGAVDLIRALGSGWRANDDEAISNALVALEDWAGLTEQGGP